MADWREQAKEALEESLGHGYSSLDNFLNALIAAVDPIIRADERERAEKVLTEAWGAATASWRSSGDTYWEGRMDALDYAIRIVGGDQ